MKMNVLCIYIYKLLNETVVAVAVIVNFRIGNRILSQSIAVTAKDQVE
jgi:hypothetical protein